MIWIHYQIIRSLSWVWYWPVKRIYQALTLIFLIFQNFLNSDKVPPAHRKPNFERLANAGVQSKIDFRSQNLRPGLNGRTSSICQAVHLRPYLNILIVRRPNPSIRRTVYFRQSSTSVHLWQITMRWTVEAKISVRCSHESQTAIFVRGGLVQTWTG